MGSAASPDVHCLLAASARAHDAAFFKAAVPAGTDTSHRLAENREEIRAQLRKMKEILRQQPSCLGCDVHPAPAPVFDDPVFRNVLIPVLTDYPLGPATLYLVYVSRRYVPLKIRTFVDFLMDAVPRISEPKRTAVG
jgi:DNA-binding transcriptional LysR family regulator